MKKVKVDCYSGRNGKFLVDADCFENKLYIELIQQKKDFPQNENFKHLFNLIENRHGHPQDILKDIFRNDIYLDYDFANKLKLYDIVSKSCFKPKTIDGIALLELIKNTDLMFILYIREWISPNKLDLEFEAADREEYREAHKNLIKGELQ